MSHLGIQLPEKLDFILEHELDPAFLNKKANRKKSSYQSKDIRENELGLISVLRTLLDLYPEYPKDKLIQFKPVQEYAKGRFRSPKSLKEMITKIEGQKRWKGNVNKEKVKTIEKDIPKNWKPETCGIFPNFVRKTSAKGSFALQSKIGMLRIITCYCIKLQHIL